VREEEEDGNDGVGVVERCEGGGCEAVGD